LQKLIRENQQKVMIETKQAEHAAKHSTEKHRLNAFRRVAIAHGCDPVAAQACSSVEELSRLVEGETALDVEVGDTMEIRRSNDEVAAHAAGRVSGLRTSDDDDSLDMKRVASSGGSNWSEATAVQLKQLLLSRGCSEAAVAACRDSLHQVRLLGIRQGLLHREEEACGSPTLQITRTARRATLERIDSLPSSDMQRSSMDQYMQRSSMDQYVQRSSMQRAHSWQRASNDADLLPASRQRHGRASQRTGDEAASIWQRASGDYTPRIRAPFRESIGVGDDLELRKTLKQHGIESQMVDACRDIHQVRLLGIKRGVLQGGKAVARDPALIVDVCEDQ